MLRLQTRHQVHYPHVATINIRERLGEATLGDLDAVRRLTILYLLLTAGTMIQRADLGKDRNMRSG